MPSNTLKTSPCSKRTFFQSESIPRSTRWVGSIPTTFSRWLVHHVTLWEVVITPVSYSGRIARFSFFLRLRQLLSHHGGLSLPRDQIRVRSASVPAATVDSASCSPSLVILVTVVGELTQVHIITLLLFLLIRRFLKCRTGVIVRLVNKTLSQNNA